MTISAKGSLDPAIRRRLDVIADLFATRKAAGAAMGITGEQLTLVTSGRSGTGFSAVVRLCAAAGVSLDWLATGEGPMRLCGAAPLDQAAAPGGVAMATFAERLAVAADGDAASLARRSGLSHRVIDKYRSGESDPSRKRLVALADAAGVNLLWLATGEGPMRPGGVAPCAPAEPGAPLDQAAVGAWLDARGLAAVPVRYLPLIEAARRLETDGGGQ